MAGYFLYAQEGVFIVTKKNASLFRKGIIKYLMQRVLSLIAMSDPGNQFNEVLTFERFYRKSDFIFIGRTNMEFVTAVRQKQHSAWN